jgi:phenylalanine 2-monooxygenase
VAVTIIRNFEQAVSLRAVAVTIGELANGPGLSYRHPDSAQVSYPRAVQAALGRAPGGGAVTRVAIVGAGPAGIAALFELRKLADANPTHRFAVEIYEADPANFLFTPRPTNPAQVVPRRAGRVSSYYAPNTIYEIGAMRFPSIAGLTWHYAEQVYGPEHVVTAFPNPGTVPTEFVFGNQFDRYVGPDWLISNSPTLKVRDIVLEGLTGTGPNPPPYMIGQRTPNEVGEALADPHTTQPELKQIQDDWGAFIKQYDSTTLEGAVRAILTTAQQRGDLPPVTGLSGQQLLDWCVELFGRFGFGTGGFKPLYNISLVEMMRLILWNYNNEYTLPVRVAQSNVDFIAQMHIVAVRSSPSNNFRAAWRLARVSDIFHRDEPRTAGIAFYDIASPNSPVQFAYFDYAIIAMPHDATTALVNRLGYSPRPLSSPEIGDFGRAARPPGVAVLPALLLSTQPDHDAVNARAVTAVSMLHMTRSSKVFATITNADATAPPVPHFEGPVSAVISDCGLAATYLVPSTTNADFRSFLVSYTWDDDSTKLENTFAAWPQNISPPGPRTMYDAMLNRAYRQDPEQSHDIAPKWWLSTVLAKAQPGDRVSWDWSTYITAGGFKLDMTGDYHQSDICFRYHTHAQYNNPARPPELRLDSRVFLASCSYSHLGGWLEGAFMSAINAVAGLVVSLNQGNVGALNAEAQKLFTTLRPVVPMN